MKPEIILVEPMMPTIEAGLDRLATVHRLPPPGADRDRLLAEVGPRIRAVVTGGGAGVRLRKAGGAGEGLKPDELNASNDD